MLYKHFVEFFSPGIFVAETTERSIASWNVEQAKKMAVEITERYGAKPYAFRFVTCSRSDDELDSKIIKRSGYYFIKGNFYNAAIRIKGEKEAVEDEEAT